MAEITNSVCLLQAEQASLRSKSIHRVKTEPNCTGNKNTLLSLSCTV